MALRYIDSMGDHYTAAQASTKWTSVGFQSRETGLHGYAMRGAFNKGIVFGSTTILIEYHLNASSLGSGLFRLADASVISQLSGTVLNDGSIIVQRFTGGTETLGQSPPDAVRTNQWYHLGIRVKVHASAGELEVRLNGAAVIGPLTGLNTTGSSFSGAIRSFLIGGNDSGILMDDLLVMDDVDDGINDTRLPGGGGFDKFIGPVHIIVKRPDGAGSVTEWTPTPTVPNWQNVDDTDPDGDTTFNVATAAEVGESDLFAMEDLPITDDVVGVQSLVYARRQGDGTAVLAKLVNEGGTTTVGADVALPDTYSYVVTPEPTLPSGLLWNRTRWNAIQYGYRRQA